MKTTRIAALSAASAFAVVALVLVYPAMAATLSGAQVAQQATTTGSVSTSASAAASSMSVTNATSTSVTGSQSGTCQNMTSSIRYGSGPTGLNNGNRGRGQTMAPPALTAGQTISLTSTNGTYRTLNSTTTGTASGSLTLSVSGTFKSGYALSITSGSLTIGGTTYTIASGSAEMGPFQAHLVGQGTLNSSAGSFLVSGSAHGGFFGSYDTLRFDVQANGVEYGVLLLVTSATS